MNSPLLCCSSCGCAWNFLLHHHNSESPTAARMSKSRGVRSFLLRVQLWLFSENFVYQQQLSSRRLLTTTLDSSRALRKDQRIPIEAKLAQKHTGEHLREELGQVKEFLKSSRTRKGILVTGDQERDPERQKHGGMQDRVYIVVI